MKSIIEQASSIMKAIEKAWNQAEQPKEFSIKVFEKEEKNFFGMSVKPAKVGIFFGDKPVMHEKSSPKPRQEIKECRSSFTKTSPENRSQSRPHTSTPQVKQDFKPAENRSENRQKVAAAHTQIAKEHVVSHEKPHRAPTTWSDLMIATTHNWIKEILSLTNMASVNFSSEVIGKNLKLTFNAPLAASPMHEKQLFRSFAHLIMSSLRNQYKQEIKDLKVILTRPE